jgi:hypothetical protein
MGAIDRLDRAAWCADIGSSRPFLVGQPFLPQAAYLMIGAADGLGPHTVS